MVLELLLELKDGGLPLAERRPITERSLIWDKLESIFEALEKLWRTRIAPGMLSILE